MIYEERRTFLKEGKLSDYLHVCKESMWPILESSNGQVLCLLGGLIGDPIDEVLQITGFSDVSSWEAAQQESLRAEGGDLIRREEARLLRPIASRPKAEVPSDDRRNVYGYRRFFVALKNVQEFARCSEEGIWPRMELLDARILGLWVTLAVTDPIEIVLLTGYHGPTHWEETRLGNPRPEVYDKAVWDRAHALGARRLALTKRTWVRLIRSLGSD